MFRTLERPALALLTRADALCNRLYGWRYNPLYQSGTIVVALWLVLLFTGLWLILFYRVGSPWESVDRLTANLWIGNWVRGLHRYATDAAIVFTALHAFRMFAQARSWGARTLAWVSGAFLVVLLYVCAWTGYIMVWDTFGGQLARESARMADALPVLSEPVSRAFTGETPMSSVFFFITLFAHIGIPLGMGVVFWLHVKRLQRPMMLPPKPLMWSVIGLLTAAAVVWPVTMAPKADPFVQAADIPTDLFVAFWLPLTASLGGGQVLLLLSAVVLALLLVPVLVARRGAAAPAPSFVDEELCTGCTQCSIDCPYGAIEMIGRKDERPTLVAHVTPDLCVSCGICAGSCAPMGVGPPGRTGRDQLTDAQTWLADPARRPGEVVVVGCAQGAGRFERQLTKAGVVFRPVSCAGNLHTSVIERIIRSGAAGVLIAACPPRDCWNREGPRWLTERVYNDREAELQPRVPRERVRIVNAGAHEPALLLAAWREFTGDVASLDASVAADEPATEPVCDPPEQDEEASVLR